MPRGALARRGWSPLVPLVVVLLSCRPAILRALNDRRVTQSVRKAGIFPGSGGGDKTGKAGTKSGGGAGKRGTSMLPKDMAAAQRKHGRGGIYGPVPLDVGPPCCQICPGKVYHELSLLQLDSHIERSALGNFHSFVKEFEDARRQRRRRQQGEIDSSDSRKKHRGDGTPPATLVRQQERLKRGRSLAGLVPVPDYMWNGNPLSRGPMANVLTTTGTLDVLHQMETKAAQQVPEHTLKGGATTPPNRPAPKDAANRNAGPCCKICVDEFVPEERADQKEQLAESLAPVQPQVKADDGGTFDELLRSDLKLREIVPPIDDASIMHRIFA